jgi:hypothetical protein
VHVVASLGRGLVCRKAGDVLRCSFRFGLSWLHHGADGGNLGSVARIVAGSAGSRDMDEDLILIEIEIFVTV